MMRGTLQEKSKISGKTPRPLFSARFVAAPAGM
jgi:hypothetical protein